MIIETYEQRVLIPDEGYWLYNEKAKVISNKVYLAKSANTNDWVEITTEQKYLLEMEWEADEYIDSQR